jgi:hypothetical protein
MMPWFRNRISQTIKMKSAVFIFVIFFSLEAAAQNMKLNNGTYFVNSSFVYYSDYKLTVSDSTFTSFYPEDTVSGKIAWKNDQLIFIRDSAEFKYPKVKCIPKPSIGDYAMTVIRLKENRYAFKIRQLTVLNVIYDQGIITPVEAD